MPYEEVTVLESPVTTRYVTPGSHGDLDHRTQRIRVSGAWFDYDPKKWKVVGNKPDVKKEALMKVLSSKEFIHDREFVDLCEAYAVAEEIVMEWMVETNNFTRYQLTPGWSVHKTNTQD